METTITRNTPFAELPEFLTLHEVAAYLGANYETVRLAVNDGELLVKRFGKRALVPKALFDSRHISPITAEKTLIIARGCMCTGSDIEVQYAPPTQDDTSMKIGIVCTHCLGRWYAKRDQ